MSKYGYVGKESDIPQQAFKANAGVLSVNDHLALSQENKLTQYGQLELIETQTTTTASTIDFLDLGNYNVHFLTYSDLQSGGYAYPSLRFYEGGVKETGSVYKYAFQEGISSGTFAEIRSTAYSYLRLGKNAYQNANGYVYLYSLLDSSKYSFVTSHHSMVEGNNLGSSISFGSGVLPQQSSVDGIEFSLDPSQAMTNLKISLYGIRYSK